MINSSMEILLSLISLFTYFQTLWTGQHILISVIIGLVDGLVPQAITWTNDDSISTITSSSEKHFNEILLRNSSILIQEMHLKLFVKFLSLMSQCVKNMGGPIKLLYVIMFEILKSYQECIFVMVKYEKFLWCVSVWNIRILYSRVRYSALP